MTNVVRQRTARRLREHPYETAHRRSIGEQWDASKRIPRDLGAAVHQARVAWASEIPRALTEGPASVGDDGNPKFTVVATQFIFGSPNHVEATDDPLLGFRTTPFRAALASFASGDEGMQKRGEIVRRITAGGQSAAQAAIAEGVPSWCAKIVAEDALRSVLGRVSDLVVMA